MTIVTEEQLKEIIPGCHDSSLGEGAEQLNGEIQHRDADGNGDNDNLSCAIVPPCAMHRRET